MSNEINPIDCADYIIRNSAKYAEAKATRIYLEEYRKSLKAILQAKSASNAVNMKEIDAYKDPEYLKHLEDLRIAIEEEEKLKWMLIAAQAKIEIYRTMEASNRNQDRTIR